MKLNRKNLKIIGLIGLIFLAIASFSIGSSHQPRLVNEASTITNPIIVENPEIFQAFYGTLNGNPSYYKVSSNKELDYT